MKLADSTGHVWHSGETNSFTMKPADWGFIKTISGNSFGLICHMIWGLIQASSENKLGNLYGPLQVSCGPLKGSCGPLADSHKPLRDSYGPSDDSCGLFRSLFQPFKQ